MHRAAVSPGRVMLLRAEVPGGVCWGSGTLIGPKLVLTAAHVVFDDDGQPLEALDLGPPESELFAGRVVWPSSYPVSYTHLRAHETKANLVCRLLLEKKK